jgi:hypothetical protein
MRDHIYSLLLSLVKMTKIDYRALNTFRFYDIVVK